MYFIILNVCAYMLLLFSVFTVITLLKKQFKQWKDTPLYILSVSDVLFSIFTSSILITNCMAHITSVNYNMNNAFCISNNMWNINADNIKQHINLRKFTGKLDTTINQNNITTKCNIINIIMKYGMLLFPFVNSFVSLLIFSMQCNLNAFHLKHQCFKYLQSEETICEDDTNINTCNIKTKFDSMMKIIKSKKVLIMKQKLKNISHVFKCNRVKKDKKVTAIFVLSQWIVPIIVTGLLYLSEYDTNAIRDIENMFYLDDCYINIKPINMSQIVDFEVHVNPLYRDHINNQDLIKLQNSNTTQVNEIISKIQNLVLSVMNDTSTIPINIITYNTSEFLNTIKYLKPDISTRIIQYNKSAENESNLLKHINFNLVNIENNTNSQNNVQISNYTDKDNEVSLFNYLITNSTKDILKEEAFNNEDNINTTEKLYFKELQSNITENKDTVDNFANVTQNYNTSVTSNDEIYIEILKYIHKTSEQNTLQNYYKNKNYHNKKQPEELKSENFHHNSTFHKQNDLSDTKIITYQNDNISKIMQVYVTDKCFISSQFLKLHLFGLVFIIYFLPILISSILQQYGKRNCQLILEKLKAKSVLLLNNSNFDSINETKNIHCNVSVDYKGPSTSKQDFIHLNENFQASKNFNKLQLIQIHQGNFNKKQDDHCKSKQYNISFDKKDIHLNMINEVENMLQLFDNIKVSLLCSILLWTPVFFELLLEVFMILYIPTWLLHVSYMVGIIFNMLRNIFNLKMIKLQEKNINTTKTNTVHPIT